MATARTFVERAHKKLGILGQGETLSNEDAVDGLNSLNEMLGSWSVEGGYVFTQTRETFPLSGATSYTIGVGADFDTVKPFLIDAAYVTSGEIDYELIQIDQVSYAAKRLKTTSGIPDEFFYDNNHPIANIFLFPKPSASYTLTLYSRKPLDVFETLDTDYDVATGYPRAIVNNLALELAAEFNIDPSPILVKNAGDSKGNVLAYNERNDLQESNIDSTLLYGRSSYNVYSGDYD